MASDWLARQPQLGRDFFGRGFRDDAMPIRVRSGYMDLLQAVLAVLEADEPPKEPSRYQPPRRRLWTPHQAMAHMRAVVAGAPGGRPRSAVLRARIIRQRTKSPDPRARRHREHADRRPRADTDKGNRLVAASGFRGDNDPPAGRTSHARERAPTTTRPRAAQKAVGNEYAHLLAAAARQANRAGQIRARIGRPSRGGVIRRFAMEQRITAGVEVEHAGTRWRIERPLGADTVLLRNDAGEIVSANPLMIRFAPDPAGRRATPRLNELRCSEEEWAEAAKRRAVLIGLAGLPSRSRDDVERAARDLGLKRRRVFELLRLAQAGCGPEAFLPVRVATRAKRLDKTVETIIKQAIQTHYAQPKRPSMQSLHREGRRFVPSGRIDGAVDPARSARGSGRATRPGSSASGMGRKRRGRAGCSRVLNPGARAPWQRVQIDSTPCDILLVTEGGPPG